MQISQLAAKNAEGSSNNQSVLQNLDESDFLEATTPQKADLRLSMPPDHDPRNADS